MEFSHKLTSDMGVVEISDAFCINRETAIAEIATGVIAIDMVSSKVTRLGRTECFPHLYMFSLRKHCQQECEAA